MTQTVHTKISRAEEKIIPWPELSVLLDKLTQAADSDDCVQLRELLLLAVDEFKPQCEVSDWLLTTEM